MGQSLTALYSSVRQQNPQLLPTFDPVNSAASGGIEHQPADVFLAGHPRTASATPGTITIGGTVATGHTITLTFVNNVFPSTTTYARTETVSVTYLTGGADTATTVAGFLAAAINANPTLQQFGFSATADTTAAGVIKVTQQSAIGNFTTLGGSSTGAETVTVNNQISGGAGPVIPVFNFEFVFNKALSYYYKGQPEIVGNDIITALVAAGLPVY